MPAPVIASNIVVGPVYFGNAGSAEFLPLHFYRV